MSLPCDSGTAVVQQQFRSAFGRAPTVLARAPGRIEVIGNHTDYNGGAVFGAAIDRYVWVAAAPAESGTRRVASTMTGAIHELPEADSVARNVESWINYPLGVWRSLADFSLPQPPGFDLMVHADLPVGAGLSSSAALELATALALVQLAGGALLPPAVLAALGRHAENRYVGVPCGILDQGTSAFGRAGHLVHIDCRGPEFIREPLPAGAHFWVFNTREKHALLDGLYAERHRECQAAAAQLGVANLCELSPLELERLASRVGGTQLRRARHVVGEHARVQVMRASLQRGALAEAGRLMFDSHASSRDLFENSTPALDALVVALQSNAEVLGARLTGGGFGGAVVALTTARFDGVQAEEVAAVHRARFQVTPEILHLVPAEGATLLPL